MEVKSEKRKIGELDEAPDDKSQHIQDNRSIKNRAIVQEQEMAQYTPSDQEYAEDG